jgi:hypothetical protein
MMFYSLALTLQLAASTPLWSCVPASDGDGWRCLRNQRAPDAPLVQRQERPLVDAPWASPRFSPLQPDRILDIAQLLSWESWRLPVNSSWDASDRQPSSRPEALASRAARTGKATAEQSKTPPPSKKATDSNGEYWVQLMAFRQASSVENALIQPGLAQQSLRIVTGGRLRQLVVGPFATFGDAERARQQLPEAFAGAFVRHAPKLRTVSLVAWQQR